MASTKYDLEKDGNNDHLIQFDFQVDGINDFSIFYYINDSGWFMSSIYELISPINSKEFNELFLNCSKDTQKLIYDIAKIIIENEKNTN